jgi:hypothetical protein
MLSSPTMSRADAVIGPAGEEAVRRHAAIRGIFYGAGFSLVLWGSIACGVTALIR